MSKALATANKEKTWTWMDKSRWIDGPWQREPDKIQWTDPETQMPCLMVRNPSGAWCGYSGVSEAHPWFSLSYSQPWRKEWDAPDDVIDVHGGLTFSEFCQEDKEHGICHIPEPGQPDRVWWFGFDCAHGGDLMPAHQHLYSSFNACGDIYRDVAYVKEQVTSLASQLSQVEK